MINPDQIEDEWYDNRPPPWWVGLALPAGAAVLGAIVWYFL